MKTDLRSEQTWLVVASLTIMAAATLALILVYTRGVMVPFVLSVFLTIIISPILDFQVIRFKFPHALAVATTLLLVMMVLALVGLLLYAAFPSIGSLTGQDAEKPIVVPVERAGDHPAGAAVVPDEHYSDSFDSLVDGLLSTLESWNIDVDKTALEAELRGLMGSLQQKMLYIITQTAGTVTSLVSQGFLIVIFIIFLLAGRNPHVVRVGIYADIESKIRVYITTKLLLSSVTGFLVWAVLALFGLKMAALFGIMAFLLNFIPSIGSVIATVLPVPVAIAQFSDPLSVWTILGVIAIPGTIQMVIGNVIEPKLMGQGLHLHPVTILLSLAFWGLLWGVIGMLLAVPMTATIRIILMRFTITEPIGNLLAGELPGAAPQVAAE